jgi:uncharacterized protein YjbI with pentapeptide repeats
VIQVSARSLLMNFSNNHGCPKMKRLLLALAAFFAFTSPLYAQNAGQISRSASGASCPGCNLFQAEFSNKTLTHKNFSKARLRQADLSLGTFTGTNFRGTDMRDVNGFGALFGRASFAHANLTNATFVGAYLEGANFKGANLSGVNFSGAEMQSAMGITQAMMDKACGDKATRAPRGIRIPICD